MYGMERWRKKGVRNMVVEYGYKHRKWIPESCPEGGIHYVEEFEAVQYDVNTGEEEKVFGYWLNCPKCHQLKKWYW
jgi:hypothetical protein